MALLDSRTTADSYAARDEHRASAALKTADFDAAITDFGRAIGAHLSNTFYLMPLSQFRRIYPELAHINDRDLLEGLRQKFHPAMASEHFQKHFTETTKPYEEFVWAGLYVSRRDAYLKAGRHRKAAAEYARSRRVWSPALDDRWRVLSKDATSKIAR